jgi:hypothetical protein
MPMKARKLERRVRVLAATVFGTIALAGCAAPATRISSSLQRYGLDAQRSDCVGTRLQRDLSIGQLQKLGRAANAYRANDTTPGALTVSDLVRVAGELKEPAIALTVVKAAAGCGVFP